MLNKIAAYILLITFTTSTLALAEPVLGDTPFPPASFTHVTDSDTLNILGLDYRGAWCYDVDANSVLITAPARERAQCELKLMYELERQKIKSDFELNKYKLRIETLEKQYGETVDIKDREIDRLTVAVSKMPADNNIWWGLGGVVVGTATTILIGWLVVSANEGFGG